MLCWRYHDGNHESSKTASMVMSGSENIQGYIRKILDRFELMVTPCLRTQK